MIRNFLLYHWGIDADESGLTKKVNWKWVLYDIAEVAVVFAGSLAAITAILLCFIIK